jgi:hypothetical protein
VRTLLIVALAACSRSPAPAPSPAPLPAPPPPPATAVTDAASPPAVPEPNRALTAGERAMLQPIFRDGVDYDAVRVVHAPLPFQPANTYMTPRGHVFAPGDLFRDDFSSAKLPPWERAVFVHELTHVWQFANGIDLVAAGLATFAKYGGRYERAYPYRLEAGRDLADYGMEQQASIVEDYYLITVAHEEPQRIENRDLARPQRDALYTAVLDRFLANARYVRALSPAELAKRHAAAEQPAAGVTACKESAADHGATHLCAGRFDH